MDKTSQVTNGRVNARAWYARSAEALAEELQTDLNCGVPIDAAARRLAQDGPNELPEAPPPSLLKLFLSQFASLIVWVLI
ncbi:MAG: hypothetical protein KF747_17280, partial [Nitrospira sp.]|nr:hypothetical protein [Nitrospira sp.]